MTGIDWQHSRLSESLAMRVEFTQIWKVVGIKDPPQDTSIFAVGRASFSFLLATDPESEFIEIDRSKAIRTLLLNSFLRGEEGPVAERVEREVEAARLRRSKSGSSTYLVCKVIDEVEEPTFQARRDESTYSVALGFDKKEFVSRYSDTIDDFIVGLMLSLPCNIERSIEPIETELIFRTAEGAPLYAFNFSFQGRLSIARRAPPDIAAVAKELAQRMSAEGTLRRPAKLLAASLRGAKDPLRRYLDCWSALEVFVNATFKSTYDAQWRAAIEAGTHPAAKPVVDRLYNVMRDKYRLADKFLVIATLLHPEDAAADVQTFRDLKGHRDNFFHGSEDHVDGYPVERIQLLLCKYLLAHLRRF